MDRNQAKFILDNIEVLKAFSEGKAVQYRHDDSDGWQEIDNPSFSPATEYRVKPDPVTISFRRYLWRDGQGKIKLGLWTPGIFGQDAVSVFDGFIKWLGETITEEVEI